MTRLGRTAVLVAACILAAPLPAAAKDSNVQMRDRYFHKPFVVIEVGDTIEWRNRGREGHTITSYEGEPLESSPRTGDDCTPLLSSADCVEPGEDWSFTFTQPGTYNYYCRIDGHADPTIRPDPEISKGDEQPCGMCGQIVVLQSSDESPQRSPSPSPSPRSTPSPDASASPSPSDDATDGPVLDEVDDPTPSPGGDPVGDAGGAPVGLALAGIAVLSGAGWIVWRRYIAI